MRQQPVIEHISNRPEQNRTKRFIRMPPCCRRGCPETRLTTRTKRLNDFGGFHCERKMSSEKNSNRSVGEPAKGIREVRDFAKSGNAVHRTDAKTTRTSKMGQYVFLETKNSRNTGRAANGGVCLDENFRIFVKPRVSCRRSCHRLGRESCHWRLRAADFAIVSGR